MISRLWCVMIMLLIAACATRDYDLTGDKAIVDTDLVSLSLPVSVSFCADILQSVSVDEHRVVAYSPSMRSETLTAKVTPGELEYLRSLIESDEYRAAMKPFSIESQYLSCGSFEFVRIHHNFAIFHVPVAEDDKLPTKLVELLQVLEKVRDKYFGKSYDQLTLVGEKEHPSVSMQELLNILEIRTWRVPLPGEKSLQWTIEVVDSVPADSSGRNVFDVITTQEEALISLRDTGMQHYRFTLAQNRGQSSGELHVAVCPSDVSCGGISVKWYDIPICRSDCAEFILAEITPMVGSGRNQQIVIKLRPQLRIPASSAVPLK
jgi:hypothetical protein